MVAPRPVFGPPPPPVGAACLRAPSLPAASGATPQLGALLSTAATPASVGISAAIGMIATLAQVGFGLLAVTAGASAFGYFSVPGAATPPQPMAVAVRPPDPPQPHTIDPRPIATPAIDPPAMLPRLVPTDSQVQLPPPSGTLTTPTALASVSEVPEPPTLPLLLLVGPLVLLARRRR